MIKSADLGFDNTEDIQRFTELVRDLSAQVKGFLPNDTRHIYLNEQIGKLDDWKEDLWSARKPRFWMSHGDCRIDMLIRCDLIEGLVGKHAADYEIAPKQT